MNPDGDENQNNLNGAPNADPTQQAIFTPNPVPQPPAPKQNQPVITGSVVEPATTGLSHPYLSNHPTQGFTSRDESGDIVLSANVPKTTKLNKKFLIIGGVVGAVLVVIVLMILLFLRGKQSTSSEATLRFNEFANYILYGKNSDEQLSGSYDNNSSYELDEQIIKNDTTYWTTAKALLNSAIKAYEDSENPDEDDNVLDSMKNLQGDLNFIINYISLEEPTEAAVISYYSQSDKETAINYVSSIYQPIAGLTSSKAQEYVVHKNEQYKNMVELVSIYVDSGCIENFEVIEGCITNDDVSERIVNLARAVNYHNNMAIALAESVADAIESNCWRISARLGEMNV